MKRQAPFAVAAAVLLLGALAVPALGASGLLPAGSQGTVYACVSSNHTLTHVSVTTPLACPSQQPVSWPVTGGGSPSPSPSPTTASPSPSPTSASPSPSPTGQACVTSAPMGGCDYSSSPDIYTGSNGIAFVQQNMWNLIPGASQTLTAYGMGDWSVTATMPAGNTAVVSGPSSAVTYTTGQDKPDPLSDFGSVPSLTSSYAQTDPAGTGLDYEWDYDIWLGNTSQTSWANDQEIMVWTDNHGQTPAGSDTGQVYTAPDGASYEIWTGAGSTSVSSTYSIVSFVRQGNVTSGALDVMALVRWLEANGYTSSSAGFDQIGYGAELCSTGGVAKTFAVMSYTLAPS